MLKVAPGPTDPRAGPWAGCRGRPGSASGPVPHRWPWPPRSWPSPGPPGRARAPRAAPPRRPAPRVRRGQADPGRHADGLGGLRPGPLAPPHGPGVAVRAHPRLIAQRGSLGARPPRRHPVHPAHREQCRTGREHPEQQFHWPVATWEPPGDPDGRGPAGSPGSGSRRRGRCCAPGVGPTGLSPSKSAGAESAMARRRAGPQSCTAPAATRSP